MSTIEKVRLCSNLMQEPHAFDKLGPVAGGIARDLTIWTAWNGAGWAILNLQDFCREFGYNRQHLLKPISEAQQQQLLAEGFAMEDVSRHQDKRGGGVLSTYIGYTLALMAIKPLNFARKDKSYISDAGQLVEERRYDILQLVKHIKLVTSPRGTIIQFAANKEILHNCRTRYQTLDLNEYKSLVTASGQKDDQARKMYLRLVWKRKYWDKAKKVQGVNPSEDSYMMLKTIAGLNCADEAQNAFRLRQLLHRVGQLETVSMSSSIMLCAATGKYKVKFKRENVEHE